jgi:hypothetical protein
METDKQCMVRCARELSKVIHRRCEQLTTHSIDGYMSLDDILKTSYDLGVSNDMIHLFSNGDFSEMDTFVELELKYGLIDINDAE